MTHSRTAAALAASLLLAPAAAAQDPGGSSIDTVQVGPWADPATWSGGVVPTAADQVDVFDSVSVLAPGAQAQAVTVAFAPGLDITEFRVEDGGSLTVGGTVTLGGPEGPGFMRQLGGSTSMAFLDIGDFETGALTLEGGDMTVGGLNIGLDGAGEPGSVGVLTMLGAPPLLNVTGSLVLFEDGLLNILTSEDGLAGLTPLSVLGSVIFNPGARIEILPEYNAEVGDRWEILNFGGSMVGDLPELIASGPYTMAYDTSVPGTLAVEVLTSPFPVPGDTCADALLLAVAGDSATFTMQLLSVSGPETTCTQFPFVGADRWFTLDNPSSDPRCVRVSVPAIKTFLSLEAYDACGGALLACDDNAAPDWTASLDLIVPGEASLTLRVAEVVPGSSQRTLTVTPLDEWVDLGGASQTLSVPPQLTGTGVACPGATVGVELSDVQPGSLFLLWASIDAAPIPALGGTLHAAPFAVQLVLVSNAAGQFEASGAWPSDLPGDYRLWFQCIAQDTTVPAGLVLSNAITTGTTPLP